MITEKSTFNEIEKYCWEQLEDKENAYSLCYNLSEDLFGQQVSEQFFINFQLHAEHDENENYVPFYRVYVIDDYWGSDSWHDHYYESLEIALLRYRELVNKFKGVAYESKRVN